MTKKFLKSVCCGLATLLVLPVYVSYLLTCCVASANVSLESHSQWISLVPGIMGNYLRNAFYRLTLEYCDPEATICMGVLISRTETRIGRHAYIGSRCMLGWAIIEDDAFLGPAVQVLSGPHIHTFESLDQPIRNQPQRPQRVTIGRDSWVGASSVVLADVSEQSVIGANSTVTKTLPPRTIAVGSPAKAVGVRGATDS